MLMLQSGLVWSFAGGWVLRLHPALIENWPETEARPRFVELATDAAAETQKLIEALQAYENQLDENEPLKKILEGKPKKPVQNAYPAGSGNFVGWVLSERYAEADSGMDESSASEPVFLEKHLADVTNAVEELSSALIHDEKTRQSLVHAAQIHDCDKADARFQALLHGGDPMAAQFAPKLLAKGAQARESRAVRLAQ